MMPRLPRQRHPHENRQPHRLRLVRNAALLAGVAALLRPALVLPDVYSHLTAHLVREEAACFVFVGLMSFWCLGHFDERRPVHLALLTFTGTLCRHSLGRVHA